MRKSKIITIVVLLVMAVPALYIMLNNTGVIDRLTKEEITGDKAYVIAQKFVSERLKSPGSAQYPANGYSVAQNGNTFDIKGVVDSQNLFGALLRSDYHIVLTYNKDDWHNPNNWSVNDISLERHPTE